MIIIIITIFISIYEAPNSKDMYNKVALKTWGQITVKDIKFQALCSAQSVIKFSQCLNQSGKIFSSTTKYNINNV